MPGRKAGSRNRNFPPQTLTEALKVPRVIQDEAGGLTTTRLTLADLLDTTPSSSVFTQLIASSRFYGLTEGGINATEFKPTILGEQAVGGDDAERSAALKQAVMNVAPFKLFFDTYANKKMPGAAAMKDFLVNHASVPEEHADAAMAHLRADAATAGLTRTISNAQWVDLDGVPQAPPADADDTDEETSLSEDVVESATNGGPPVEDTQPPAAPPAPPEPEIPQAIFVAGRKGTSLTQLTKILDEYKIPYILAEDQANEGRPISVKVAETMGKCGAAILVFTADEELRDLDGEPVWKSSENISHELGAAGMLYGNRIVIFREERVKLASNFKDIGHITFTEGELNAKGIELFRELIAFGLVNITVGSG
jgi:hypothetical protein